ncbi:XLF-domain-containing protein [Ophiobolus disseminans]|uniref:Non-homologous end-joining factor 1 n=1 Tax=Ophiobolus disseminans TaxID=1469910 RepID=A0A6A6ZMV0_9PLEO|nr:XLF-domain-containing protein [Ophiobolus disseminans]
MSCWRVLELAEQPDGEQIPQLLVKPVFASASYTIHLTCLSNIWSEVLDVDAVVDRALQQQSPIEVSKQDPGQLAILLDHVKRSLENSSDAVCRLTRHDADGITLHTTIGLPQPLDCLTWKFYLEKRTSTVLKNELILPLLISSHIQHGRITGLISTIADKDKAITRLVNQYESSNLDLAAAFPIISGLKSGRRVVKHEQAARHIPALQPFREDAFKQKTGHLVDSDVSTLGLFQEALSECAPDVPSQLRLDDGDLNWWASVPDRLNPPKVPVMKTKKSATVDEPVTARTNSSDDETEDEFETHANFKIRKVETKTAKQPGDLFSLDKAAASDDDATEDEDDLDAPPKSHGQKSGQSAREPPRHTKSLTPEDRYPPKPDTLPVAKSKVKGFRIGGKADKSFEDPPPPVTDDLDAAPDAGNLNVKEQPASQINAHADTTPKKVKRPFRIGGKGKGAATGSLQMDDSNLPITDRTRATESPIVQPPSSPPVGVNVKKEIPIVVEEHEETPEEKAERRRADLKRKTEEAAKKQAQTKKKRRF